MEKENKFSCVMDDDEYVQSWKKDLYGRLNDVKIEALDLSQKAEKAKNQLMKIQTKNDMEKFCKRLLILMMIFIVYQYINYRYMK